MDMMGQERLCRDERTLPLGHSPAELESEQR